ncbi:MAG: hypothetical protein ACD_57C00117G0001 [uncultured bacterium]|nr:MAG: hypothetical protein ACD_57C00117G0001 [uncultured bacterium]
MRSTSQLIEIHFSGLYYNPQQEQDFLATHTIGYLKAAEQGFFMAFDVSKRTSDDEVRRLNGRGEEALRNAPDSEAHEAFRFALMVFTFMPELADKRFTITKYARPFNLESPTSGTDVLQRIRELQIGIAKISTGQVERDFGALNTSSSLIRTYEFFKVGDELSQRLTKEQLKAEEEAAIKKTVQRLTSDIPGLDSL